MKNTKWLGLTAVAAMSLYSGCAQAPPAPQGAAIQVEAGPPGQPDAPGGAVAAPVDVSPAAAEVVKLAESGVSDDVVLGYVQNSQAPFNLSADTILYMKDLGLSSPVITAMLNHDSQLASQAPAAAPPVVTPAPIPQVSAPLTPSEPPPAYVGNAPEDVNYFYNDLSPYGSWVVLDGIGWCWQPRCAVISHGWRPYCDSGHWVNSDCGWYWASDYSWGWAPFHYGRWQLHERNGWVWCPDRTWGPAWVTWRSGGDNCGWAPLPPRAVFEVGSGWRFNGVRVGVEFDFGLRPDHFTFIALHDFGARDIGHHRITEVRNVYNHTTIINNTTIVNNRTIVNRGIPVERVSAVTHTEFRRAEVREASAPGGGGSHVVRATGVDRGAPVVYRHEVRAPAQPVHVVAQRVDASHPIIRQPEIRPVVTPNRPGFTTGGRTGGNVRPEPRTLPQPRTTTPSDRELRTQPNRGGAVNERNLPQQNRPVTTEQPRFSGPTGEPRQTVSPAQRSQPVPYSNDPLLRRNENRPNTTAPTVGGNPGTEYRNSVQGQGQGSHVYTPKSGQQSSEIRSVPRSAPRSEAPRPAPQPRGDDGGNGHSHQRGQ